LRVAGQGVGGQGDGRHRAAVVDLVDAVGADRQVLLGDVRRRAGGGVELVVVAGVGARDGDARDADGLAGAHVLVGEGGAVAGADGVAGQGVGGQGDGRHRAAVVDLVDAVGADRQVLLGDVRRRAGGG